MDASDDEIEFRQCVLGDVHGPIAANVALKPREHADAESRLIKLAHTLRERHHTVFVKAIGHGQRFRVIRDGHVLVTHRAGRLGHLFERGAAVGLGGVDVQVAANIGGAHKSRKTAVQRRFHLAAVFAQLGGNPGQAESLVDLFFCFAGHAHFALDADKPVFIEREAHFQRARPQRDIVFFAAGEVLQRCAEAFRGQSAQVHLNAFETELHAGFVGAFAEHFGDARMLHEAVESRPSARSGGQQVDIAQRLAAPPKASGCRDSFDSRRFRQPRSQLIHGLVTEVEEEPARALPVLRYRPQHLLFEFRAHARQLAQFLLDTDALKVVHRTDAVVLEQQRDAFGAQSLDFQQFQGRGRIFRQQ